MRSRRYGRTGTRWLPLLLAVAALGTGGSGAAVAVRGLDDPAAALRPAAVEQPLGADLPLVPPAAPTSPGAAPVASPSAAAPGPADKAASTTAPAPAASAAPVRPLGALREPDLLVEVPGGLSAAQLARLDAVRGVEALTALDVGTVRLAGGTGTVAGVDPSTFRAFTPQETAASDPLWQSVARGELAPSYGLQRSRSLALGGQVAVAADGRVEGRVGAVAAFAVPDVDLVVNRDVARRLGVQRSTAVLLAAPGRSLAPLRRAVREVTGTGAEVTVLRPAVVAAPTGRPRSYRELYVDSARYCSGLSWTVLAAIGQVESGHGRNLGPSSAGALGPMQFLPSTWASYGVDGDRDGDADINDPFDAVPSAALYLCRNGAGRGADGLYDAVFAYNHADWYVRKVLGLAEQYRAQG